MQMVQSHSRKPILLSLQFYDFVNYLVLVMLLLTRKVTK